MSFRDLHPFRSKPVQYQQLNDEKSIGYHDDDGKTSCDSNGDTNLFKDDLEYSTRTKSIHIAAIVLAVVCGICVGILAKWLVDDRLARWTYSEIREFAPKMPLSTVVFEEIRELYDPPSAETNAYWDSLVPPGNGFVQVPNPEDYNLEPGIMTPSGVERYSVAMYHQLHCLAVLRRYYWGLVDAIQDDGDKNVTQTLVHDQIHHHHPHHCFAYLAQSVMCNADLTMEWAMVEEDGRRFQVDGWGIPHRTCKDPKAVRAWAEKHHSPARANSMHIDGAR